MKKIIIGMVICILLAGCTKEQNAPAPVVETLESANDIVTELCICHTVNPDGSVVLWGDRQDSDKFYAYVMQNTLNLSAGAEIAIQYSESARQTSRNQTNGNSITWIMDPKTVQMIPITEKVAEMAIDGSRKERYMQQYHDEIEQAVVLNTDASTAAQSMIADIPMQQYTVQTFQMDNTKTSNPGFVGEIDVQISARNTRITINDKSIALSAAYTYVYALDYLDVGGYTITTTVSELPQYNSVIIYLNTMNQICAGRITSAQAMPDDYYLITFEAISIADIVN